MSDERSELIALVTSCYSSGYDSKIEQKKIPNPFPAGGGYITDPDSLCMEFYLGEQWKRMGSMPSWKSRPVNNMIMPAVENYVTFITDNNPSPSITPREEGDSWLAPIMRAAVDYVWDRECIQVKLTDAVRASSIDSGGMAWLYTPWENGTQKVEVLLDEAVVMDCETSSENFDPSYGIYEYRASLGNLKAAYPTPAHGSWDDFDDSWTPTRTRLIERVQAKFKQMADTAIKSPVRTVTVYKMWIRDTSKEEFTEHLDDKILHRRKTKYPNGWRVLTFAGGLVLEDKPMDERHGEIPLTPVFCYKIPGRLYGRGHVVALLPMQIQHNRMNQLLFDSTVKKGGGIILLGAGLDLDKAAITNAPVQVHNVRDVNQFRVAEFPDPPRHVFNYLDKLEAMGRDVVGQHESSVGKMQPGNKTALEIDTITANDKTRVRSISRSLAWSLERVLKQIVSNLAQFEDSTWFLRIIGDDGSEESVEFNPSKMLRKVKDGRISEDMVEFDLKIADSSMLPDSANELMQQALNLFDRGAMSKYTLMKTLKVPNPKQELLLMQEEQKQIQAQQAQVQQTPAPEQQAAPPQMPPQMPEPQAPQGASSLPPEVMAQVEALAAQEGIDPQAVIDQLMGGGV